MRYETGQPALVVAHFFMSDCGKYPYEGPVINASKQGLVRTIEELKRENAALRADKERLDKLEKMLVDAKILPTGGNEPIEERYLRLGILRGETMRQFLDSVSVE